MLEIYCLETQTSPSRFLDLFVLAIICCDYRDFIAFSITRFLACTIILRKTAVFIAFSKFLDFIKSKKGNKITHLAENYCPRPIR